MQLQLGGEGGVRYTLQITEPVPPFWRDYNVPGDGY